MRAFQSGHDIVVYLKDRIRKFGCVKAAAFSTRFSFGIGMTALLSVVEQVEPELYPSIYAVAEHTQSQMAAFA